jgi:predicted dehydrogenase
VKKANIGIVGCGQISDIYFSNLSQVFLQTNIHACCDLVGERAKEKSEKWNIPNVMSFEQMIACKDIDIVVILTAPQSHYPLAKKALEAGKHVYTEKPLALSVNESLELVKLAKEKGRCLSSAPDTFLGAGIQTARKLLDSGYIGNVVAGFAAFTSHGFEGRLFNHPDNSFHYKPHVGPVADVGIYYITALINLFGPIDEIRSMTARGLPERVSTSPYRYGAVTKVEVDTHSTSLVRFRNGIVFTMISTFEAWASILPAIEVYGTRGTMNVPDPNSFGNLYPSDFGPRYENGFRCLRAAIDNGRGQKEWPMEWRELPYEYLYAENSRGLGVADMARCVIEGGRPRISAEFNCHVLEAMLAMADGEAVHKMQTGCERPEPMNPDVLYGLA